MFLSETDSGVALTKNDPDFEVQMQAAQEVMASRRAAPRELAK